MIMIVKVRLVIVMLIYTKGKDGIPVTIVPMGVISVLEQITNRTVVIQTHSSFHISVFFRKKLLIRKYVHPYPLDVTTSQPDKSFTTPPPV